MASILDFLNTETGKEFIQKSSREIDETPEKVESALGMALPMMLGGLKKNTQSQQGEAELAKELDKDKHDGSLLDNLKGINPTDLLGEGSGILGHIFGGNQSRIEDAVSSATGIETSKISKLLKMAAPVVLGILGKQKRKDNTGKRGIKDLVGSVLGTNSSHDQSLLESFLDTDNDNNIAKDMAGKLFGNKEKSKGLGDFFKG